MSRKARSVVVINTASISLNQMGLTEFPAGTKRILKRQFDFIGYLIQDHNDLHPGLFLV